MSDVAMYIMVIAAIGIGVMVMTKKFLKTRQSKEFTYRSTRSMPSDETPIEKRINFRKKPFEKKDNGLPERSLSFRDSYNKATKRGQSISNVELNTTFWLALAGLVGVVILIILL